MAGAGNVLVFGATGFLGTWICREFDTRGTEYEPAPRNAGGDLLDPQGLEQLIARQQPSAIVNAAGFTSPAESRKDPAGCFEVNTGGVFNLLEAIRRQSPDTRLVTISSAAVYTGQPPFDENAATAVTGPYAASKLAAEILCGQYRRGYGIDLTVLRCFNLIGPGEPQTQATSEFSLAALAAGTGQTVEIPVGSPDTARDFTDVRDAARAVTLLLDKDVSGTFNLCCGRSRSLAEIANAISSLAGRRITLKSDPDRPGQAGPSAIYGSSGKLREATGWSPQISIEESLEDLLASLG